MKMSQTFCRQRSIGSDYGSRLPLGCTTPKPILFPASQESLLSTDPQLLIPGNIPWLGSPWWVSDQRTGLSTLYNGAGTKEALIVTIPPADPN